MPRNAQGIYSLPAGNPVVPGTLIESTWANPTMSDIAAALTGSLPRNGSAGMQGPLILAGDATQQLAAVPLQQLNSAIGGTNSFLPAGAIQLFAMGTVPSGWLECNGAAVSRTTYANLFAAIGETYGAGNGTTTFNLPDLRGQFVRGWDNGRGVDPGRAVGSQQNSANQAHTHTATATNPAHTHGIADPGHLHTVADPGHIHSGLVDTGTGGGGAAGGSDITLSAMGAATTGVALFNSQTGVTVQSAVQNTTVDIAAQGTEARPTNVAMVYAIKAFGALQTDGLGSMAFQNANTVAISGGSGVFSSLQCTTAPTQPNDVARLADIGSQLADIFSSDPAVLLVDKTNPTNPILRPQTNVPSGMCKLDAAGYVPSSVLNVTDLTFLGTWDAAPGLLPTGTFATGDYYQIDVAGTLTLNTSGGSVAQPCNVGDQIIYNAATPGWWYTPAAVASSLPASAIVNTPYGSVTATNVQGAIDQLADQVVAPVAASGVSFVPGGTISANNVQGAISELDTEKAPIGASYTKAESDSLFRPKPYASGEVIQQRATVDAGSTTSSNLWINVTNTAQSIVPKSTNSKIVVECTFQCTVPALVSQLTAAQFYLNDGTTFIGSQVDVSAPSGLGNTGIVCTVTVKAILDNVALAARQFLLFANTPQGPTITIYAVNQHWTLTEIQN
jgi:microcystin-dependent protein